MKNQKTLIKRIVIMLLVAVNIMPVSFAAWWGTPGYEWCLSKGITSMRTQNELKKDVTNEDFYALLLRYLRVKDVKAKKSGIIQTLGYTENINPVIAGLITNINNYLKKSTLTPEEYRQVVTYMDHAESNVSSHMSLVDRETAKDFFLYISLARYRAAMLINNRDYRNTELAKYSNVKYKDIFFYGMTPYFGKITRREFLVLMFSLLAEGGSGYSAESIITTFNESGVLLGWDNDLWLDERLSYAEMFTFLYRFEAFDFDMSNNEDTNDETAAENK